MATSTITNDGIGKGEREFAPNPELLTEERSSRPTASLRTVVRVAAAVAVVTALTSSVRRAGEMRGGGTSAPATGSAVAARSAQRSALFYTDAVRGDLFAWPRKASRAPTWALTNAAVDQPAGARASTDPLDDWVYTGSYMQDGRLTALIENPMTREAHFVRVGAVLLGAHVRSISAYRVVFSESGKLRKLIRSNVVYVRQLDKDAAVETAAAAAPPPGTRILPDSPRSRPAWMSTVFSGGAVRAAGPIGAAAGAGPYVPNGQPASAEGSEEGQPTAAPAASNQSTTSAASPQEQGTASTGGTAPPQQSAGGGQSAAPASNSPSSNAGPEPSPDIAPFLRNSGAPAIQFVPVPGDNPVGGTRYGNVR